MRPIILRSVILAIAILLGIPGCISRKHFITDTYGTRHLNIGEELSFASGEELRIQLVSVDVTNRTALFKVHDTIYEKGNQSEYVGRVPAGDFLRFSPWLRVGSVHLSHLDETGVVLIILGLSE